MAVPSVVSGIGRHECNEGENLYRPACSSGSITMLVYSLVFQHFVGHALALRRWPAASSHHSSWPRLWQSKFTHTHKLVAEHFWCSLEGTVRSRPSPNARRHMAVLGATCAGGARRSAPFERSSHPTEQGFLTPKHFTKKFTMDPLKSTTPGLIRYTWICPTTQTLQTGLGPSKP